ncbi:MAG: hypothetical protein U5L00_07780 [Desulfovermiculus sp.]|nr:hypothetical protein [Desulfovermiculus sp.]
MDNPDIALIRKGIKALKNDIKELQKEIDLRKYKLGNRQDKRIEKKLTKLEQEKAEKKPSFSALKISSVNSRIRSQSWSCSREDP